MFESGQNTVTLLRDILVPPSSPPRLLAGLSSLSGNVHGTARGMIEGGFSRSYAFHPGYFRKIVVLGLAMLAN